MTDKEKQTTLGIFSAITVNILLLLFIVVVVFVVVFKCSKLISEILQR